MTIALDYDDTYTLNPELFNEIIKVFKSHGYKVLIVTYRHSTAFNDMNMNIKGISDYVFTGGIAKEKYCNECGIEIDIWIDDSPEAIIYSFKDLPIR